MTTIDIDFDETRGGDRHRDNLLTVPREDPFYKATIKALGWRPAGAHDPERAVVPSIMIENMFRCALVDGARNDMYKSLPAKKSTKVKSTGEVYHGTT